MNEERAPAVAGLFYPDDPIALRNEVQAFLGEECIDDPALLAIAPHAGYRYSGAIAGEVYRRIHVPDTAIVLCPNHTGVGARDAIISRGAFRMPGGAIKINGALADSLRDAGALTEDRTAHAREHALEVHLPFLRARNVGVQIVPVCLGFVPYTVCHRIGTAIADVIAKHGGKILIVASTDMSHYISASAAATLDQLALDRILALDAEGLHETVVKNDISMCGVIPVTTALVAARALGANGAELVRYGNSGEVSGDLDRVVGYAGLTVA